MNDTHPADMAEATRLTRAGRLAEATALIQRLLHGHAAAPTAASPVPHVPGRLQRFLDGLRRARAERHHPDADAGA